MTPQAIIEVPLALYERAQHLAQQRQQDLSELIADMLDLTATETVGDEAILATETENWSEPDDAVEREMQAYIAMHPVLKQKHLGKYGAIYQGQLIDYDEDGGELYARIDQQHPEEFVWLSKVEEDAIPILHFRSPRFV